MLREGMVLRFAVIILGAHCVECFKHQIDRSRTAFSRTPPLYSLSSILSLTTVVSPVKTMDELQAVSKFFIGAFFTLDESTAVRTRLEEEQVADWKRRFINEDENLSTLFVAKDFGKIVGCISVSCKPYSTLGSDGEPYDPRNPNARPKRDKAALVPIIANLAVGKQSRRRGIGEKLIKKCEALSKTRGYEEIVLAVESSNSAAEKLYKKCGFSVLWRQMKADKISVTESRIISSKTLNTAMVKKIR